MKRSHSFSQSRRMKTGWSVGQALTAAIILFIFLCCLILVVADHRPGGKSNALMQISAKETKKLWNVLKQVDSAVNSLEVTNYGKTRTLLIKAKKGLTNVLSKIQTVK